MEIRIHPLFWFMMFLSVWSGYFLEAITLFVLVIIHELGHVTAAWSYGWRIRSMELLPFGGMAKTDEWGTVSAREEIVVALAGPFHHVWLIVISYVFYMMGFWSQDWMAYFIQGNLMLALFNLLPIYPLDGGRVFAAVLSYWVPYRQCLYWTGVISLFLSVGLFVSSFLFPGVTVHFPLLLISFFLLFSNVKAIRQKQVQFIRFLLHRHYQGMKDDYAIQKVIAMANEPLAKVIKRWYKERYHVVEVVDERGNIFGFLPEEMVLQKYFQNPNARLVIDFPDF